MGLMAEHVDLPDWGFRRADGLMPEVAASVVGYAARGMGVSLHRGVPSPHVTFVITLDEPVITGWSVAEAAGPDATCVDVVTAGLHLAPAYIRQPPAQSGIQLALHPSAARTILGLPASELFHGTYEGRDVVGPEISRLRERLIGTPDWRTRFALVQRFLQDRKDRVDSRTQLRPEVAEAWTWLARHRGTGRISSLAEHVLLSQRQLHHLFTAEFGVGPKRFNRLLRFHRAKRMISHGLDQGGDVDLARIAVRCGYADQSHLTRDFRSLMGISPGRWLTEEYAGMGATADGSDNSAETFNRRPAVVGRLKP